MTATLGRHTRPRRPSPPVAWLALAAAGLLTPRSVAQVIVTQRATDTFIAFEAEGNATINNPAATTGNITFADNFSDAGASGGRVLFTQSNGTPPETALAAGSPNVGTATYTLRFAQPGSYQLYYRWRASADAAVQTTGFQGNSFYLPTDFGAAPATTSASNGFSTTSTPPSTSYIAISDLTYTVSAAQVNTALTFAIQTRESFMYIDRFIFSSAPIDVTNGSTTLFDAVPNSPVVVPEPASFGLVAAAAVAALAIRRRASPATRAR